MAAVVAALLPRAVVERSELSDNIGFHVLMPLQAWVETLFIRRRAAHQYSALAGFIACLAGKNADIAA